MTTVRTDEQRLAVGTVVNLYTIDATGIGGSVHRFVPGARNGALITYKALVYRPIPIEVEGIDYGGQGAASRPTMAISRLDQPFVSALVGLDNLRGARVTRLRTMDIYLDGEPDADPDRHWPIENYLIERLTRQDKSKMVWQLASPIDYDKKQLPGRQILRDVCAWQYRHWTGTAWEYKDALCPYTGSSYFDANDNPVTDPAEDKCSRCPSGCQIRFPRQAIPFGGFIGVARNRH